MALEKDWVPILCRGNQNLLTTVNSRMRRIDLFCKLIAPAVFGIAMTFIHLSREERIMYGSISVLVWNVVGLFLGIILFIVNFHFGLIYGNMDH